MYTNHSCFLANDNSGTLGSIRQDITALQPQSYHALLSKATNQ